MSVAKVAPADQPTRWQGLADKRNSAVKAEPPALQTRLGRLAGDSALFGLGRQV